MTREEKARSYDEALERARKQRDEYQEEFDKTDKNSKLASILRAAISAVELAFPELVESEDEKNWKAVMEYVKDDALRSWLEKQKEQKSAEWAELQSEFKNINEAFENGKKEVLTHPKKYGLCEQKPVDYDAELKKCKDNPLYFFDKYVSIKQKPVDNPKWNELTWKDINELERIINNVHYEFQNGIGEDSFGELVLERFREYKDDGSMDEQKPAEWSEEDEEILKLLILNIGRYMYFGGMSSERILSFLKSLRPQYHGDVTMTEAYKMGLEAGKASSWKPSEEDLMMLEHIIGQYEIGNKNSKVMGYLPRIEELDFLKKVLAKWKN